MPRLSDTRDYHRHGRVDLLAEFTICESLGSADTPYSRALRLSSPYGAMVGRRLAEMNLLRPGCRICEVGGGYGSLMRGLLEAFSPSIGRVVMIDLSDRLLARQRARLAPWGPKVAFVQGDVSELIPSLQGVDLIILNEVIGDLDTWTDISADTLPPDVEQLVRGYGLAIPEGGPFHFNLGALRLLEGICERGFAAFLSEHSCDPIIPPEMAYLARGLDPGGFPREIRLKDHSEFTIRFSHLLRVAGGKGRKTATGSLLDLIGLENDSRLEFAFRSRASLSDEQEILHEFLDHVREYRWLIVE